MPVLNQDDPAFVVQYHKKWGVVDEDGFRSMVRGALLLPSPFPRATGEWLENGETRCKRADTQLSWRCNAQ